ncbi:hypothetical protein [Streptosporangium sp. NPDC006007]|uniref:hypothetical protein n=1 Tax=Streptosporangium sp. NPDC006007 TaxID=3154575 RepID=UPI0033BD742F
MGKRVRVPAPVDILDDGAISHREVGYGRLIPLVIIDTRKRPDITELIRTHVHLKYGDVKVQWGRLPHENVGLVLEFVRPVELKIVIRFNIERRGGIVDQIISTESLYIQSGKPGDKASTGSNDSRILLEVPDTGFKVTWEKLVRKSLSKRFKKKGLDRKSSVLAASQFLEEWRKLGQFRLPPR